MEIEEESLVFPYQAKKSELDRMIVIPTDAVILCGLVTHIDFFTDAIIGYVFFLRKSLLLFGIFYNL